MQSSKWVSCDELRYKVMCRKCVDGSGLSESWGVHSVQVFRVGGLPILPLMTKMSADDFRVRQSATV